MNEVLFRFLIVWLVLHIILYFVELYRYKHSSYNLRAFWKNGMLDFTYFIEMLDTFACIFCIVGIITRWVLQPIL